MAYGVLGSVLLAGGVAVAEPPGVEVEVVVQAEPRSITVTGAPSIEVLANTDVTATEPMDATTRLSFANPVGNGSARVEATRDGTDLGSLELNLWPPEGDGYFRGDAKWSGTSVFTWPIVTHIGEGVSKDELEIEFRLTGQTGTPRTVATTITFAIGDN